MTAKINRKLYLVVPIQQGERTLYAHSAPIASETFDAYFLVLAKTFAAIYAEGLGVMAGPRVAARLLRSVAESIGQWEASDKQPGANTVKDGLMRDIRQRTNIFAPTDHGWDMIPLEEAIKKGVIDQEDASEVDNAIVFFTVAWHMHKRTDREEVLSSAALLWGAQLESLGATDFQTSLGTSTTDAGTGKSAA